MVEQIIHTSILGHLLRSDVFSSIVQLLSFERVFQTSKHIEYLWQDAIPSVFKLNMYGYFVYFNIRFSSVVFLKLILSQNELKV